MRYGADHKQATHARILREARRLFRRHGYDGVGVEAIMGACGLTRGGFYAHFRSKAALFAEVLEGEHDFVERMRTRTGRSRRALADQALEVVAGYLAPPNRKRVSAGCSLAALPNDTARADRRARQRYGRTVRDLSCEFERGLRDPRPDDPRALASIALCVGGLLLSRAVADPELADAISNACRDAAARTLESPAWETET